MNIKTDGDRIAIEFGTDTQNEAISRAVVLRSGGGYKKLPTATVSSEFGSSAQVYGITNDIGSVEDINLRNSGFDYGIIPDVTARANFQIKNVTGDFKNWRGTYITYRNSLEAMTQLDRFYK